MHAWAAGGYWALDKRRSDLQKMRSEWQQWQAANAMHFAELVSCKDVQNLAQRLHARADELAGELAAAAAPGQPLATVVHGDFKTANLFFRRTAGVAQDGGDVTVGSSARHSGHTASRCSDDTSYAQLEVAACDFQWAGAGVAVQDVVYLLWTSVEP